MVTDITEQEVESLTQSILTRYGIDFTCYEPKSLRRRIIRVINNFNLSSTSDLWVKFLRERNFIHVFMNEISVGMTSMFLDPILWKSLKRDLPLYFPKQSIDVWHAGCSTGEEVYTLAIVLNDAGLAKRVRAVATDINQDALRTAQEGSYHKIKMIENENNYREYAPFGDFHAFCSRHENHVLMNPSLTSHVSFHYQNLIMDNAPSPGLFDVIFCRNVMIYFDQQAKQKVLRKFYDALKPGGYLIIGFYDTMMALMDETMFRLANAEAKIFQRIN